MCVAVYYIYSCHKSRGAGVEDCFCWCGIGNKKDKFILLLLILFLDMACKWHGVEFLYLFLHMCVFVSKYNNISTRVCTLVKGYLRSLGAKRMCCACE